MMKSPPPRWRCHLTHVGDEHTSSLEFPWETRIDRVKGSRVEFTHRSQDSRNGVERESMDRLSGYIEFGEGEPKPHQVYEVKRAGDVIGHAEYNALGLDGQPHWHFDMFNVVRGKC